MFITEGEYVTKTFTMKQACMVLLAVTFAAKICGEGTPPLKTVCRITSNIRELKNRNPDGRNSYRMSLVGADRGYTPNAKYTLTITTNSRRSRPLKQFRTLEDQTCPKKKRHIRCYKLRGARRETKIAWRAPRCGCVTLRVEVLAVHSRYYTYITHEQLTKRICPRKDIPLLDRKTIDKENQRLTSQEVKSNKERSSGRPNTKNGRSNGHSRMNNTRSNGHSRMKNGRSKGRRGKHKANHFGEDHQKFQNGFPSSGDIAILRGSGVVNDESSGSNNMDQKSVLTNDDNRQAHRLSSMFSGGAESDGVLDNSETEAVYDNSGSGSVRAVIIHKGPGWNTDSGSLIKNRKSQRKSSNKQKKKMPRVSERKIQVKNLHKQRQILHNVRKKKQHNQRQRVQRPHPRKTKKKNAQKSQRPDEHKTLIKTTQKQRPSVHVLSKNNLKAQTKNQQKQSQKAREISEAKKQAKHSNEQRKTTYKENKDKTRGTNPNKQRQTEHGLSEAKIIKAHQEMLKSLAHARTIKTEPNARNGRGKYRTEAVFPSFLFLSQRKALFVKDRDAKLHSKKTKSTALSEKGGEKIVSREGQLQDQMRADETNRKKTHMQPRSIRLFLHKWNFSFTRRIPLLCSRKDHTQSIFTVFLRQYPALIDGASIATCCHQNEEDRGNCFDQLKQNHVRKLCTEHPSSLWCASEGYLHDGSTREIHRKDQINKRKKLRQSSTSLRRSRLRNSKPRVSDDTKATTGTQIATRLRQFFGVRCRKRRRGCRDV